MPWNELLANLAIVALASSIWTAINGTVTRFQLVWQRLALGCLMGVATLLGMLLPFQFVPGVFLDLRYTLIAISGFFGGPLAAAFPLVVAVVKRLALGGTGVWVAIPNIAIAFGVGCLGHRLTRVGSPSNLSLTILSLGVVLSGTLGFFVMMPVERWPAMTASIVAPFGLILFVATFFSGLAIAQERKRQAILKENWTYRAVTDALPDCLSAKDLDGNFIAANPATAKLMVANGVGDLIGRSDADFYDKETAAAFRQQELDLVADGVSRTFEEEVRRPDGEAVWLSTLKAPLTDDEGYILGIITHNRDITDKKRLELALTEAQHHLTDALANMADGLALFDASGNLVFSNSRYLEMFPMTADVRVPGASLTAIIQTSLDRRETISPEGQEPESIDRIVEQLTAAAGSREIRMADGRWLQARTRETSNGGSMIMFTDISRLKEDEHTLMELNVRLHEMATTDGLTGLTNRRSFDTRLHEAVGLSETQGDVGLLMIDVDSFKLFNDNYGHPAGDECLCLVAGCLSAVVAAFPQATVARYGGEEFGIVLPRLGLSETANVGKLVMTAVRALGDGDPDSPMTGVTVSVGVTSLKSGPITEKEFLKRADAALYEAKAAGRDCIRISPLNTMAENAAVERRPQIAS